MKFLSHLSVLIRQFSKGEGNKSQVDSPPPNYGSVVWVAITSHLGDVLLFPKGLSKLLYDETNVRTKRSRGFVFKMISENVIRTD